MCFISKKRSHSNKINLRCIHAFEVNLVPKQHIKNYQSQSTKNCIIKNNNILEDLNGT